MKTVYFFLGLVMTISIVSCESKKTRADIEKDFEGVEDVVSDEQFATSERRFSGDENPKAFEGKEPTDPTPEQKQQQVETTQQEAVSVETQTTDATTAATETPAETPATNTNGNASTEKPAEVKSAQPVKASEPAKPAEPARKTEQTTTTPAKATAEPAKAATPSQPARQQPVVTKSEPKKRDVVVDGQAQ